jgi:hypothetical protein
MLLGQHGWVSLPGGGSQKSICVSRTMYSYRDEIRNTLVQSLSEIHAPLLFLLRSHLSVFRAHAYNNMFQTMMIAQLARADRGSFTEVLPLQPGKRRCLLAPLLSSLGPQSQPRPLKVPPDQQPLPDAPQDVPETVMNLLRAQVLLAFPSWSHHTSGCPDAS